MRISGRILGSILGELGRTTKAGMTTLEINDKAEALMAEHKVQSSFKGYHGFPAVICSAVNSEVVHGIPTNYVLKDGDIVTIDCGVIYKKFHSDSAITVLIGNVEESKKAFVYATQKALEKALTVLKPGARVGDIGFAVQQYIEKRGYSIVRDYVGHGIGRSMHEDPQIPNFGQRGKGPLLTPGMAIAIEPITIMGERFTETLPDDWTVVSRDGTSACQIEHTIAITPTGYEVLTARDGNINNVFPQ